MKKIFLFEFCLALLGASSLYAQDAIWKNASSGSWSNSALWENGVIADGGYAADFSTSNLQSNVTVNLDGARTIGYLRIGDAIPSHDFLMSSSNASVLTLSNRSSPVPVIDVQNRTTTISHALAGSAGFKKRGNGTLILQALNSLTGEVQVNEGTLQLNYNSGGSGSLRQSIRVNPGARLLSTVSNGIGYSGNNWVRTIYLNHASLEHTVANSDFGWGVTYTLTGSSMSTTASGGRFSAGSGTLINTLASSTSSVTP